MKFYRKLSYEDLDQCAEYWNNLLSFEVRDLIKTGDRVVSSRIRNEKHCSLEEAKSLKEQYQIFLRVIDDWKEDKEIYTDY